MKRINPMFYVCLFFWALSAMFFALSMGCTLDPQVEYVYLPPVVEPDDPIPVELGAMEYITYDGTDVIFVYENGVYPFASGTAVSVGDGIITVGDILYYLDGVGNITASYRLPCVADAVGISGPDVYSAHIEGATTRIYKNTSDQGVYPWVIDHINVTMTGDVVAVTTAHVFVSLSGSEADIIYAAGGGVFVFDLDQILKTATFRDGYDYHESWGTNYFWRNTGWLKSGTLWIGSNGYTWDAGGLTENAGAMYTWNSYPYPVQDVYNESPLVIPAAVRLEHGEDVTYWIECNTGYLIRYTVSLDLIEAVIRLYPADGLKSSGILLMHSLSPIVITDALYYHFGGFLYAYDFTGGAVSVIGSDVEIWRGI